MDKFVTERHNMIKGQVITNKVTSPKLIDSISIIPRHRFVDEAKESICYTDCSVSVGEDQFLHEIKIFARMLELADIKKTDKVLDINCQTGYSSAIISKIANSVTAIEDNAKLISKANQNIKDLKIDNVIIIETPTENGWVDNSPYDVIIMNKPIKDFPENLTQQLSTDGKIIFLKELNKKCMQIILGTKINNKLSFKLSEIVLKDKFS